MNSNSLCAYLNGVKPIEYMYARDFPLHDVIQTGWVCGVFVYMWYGDSFCMLIVCICGLPYCTVKTQ